MEISLNKTELTGALPALGKMVSRTSLIKAYQAIQIEGRAHTLFFRTRNVVEGIEFRMDADLEDDFPAVLVEFEQFRLAVRNCKKAINEGLQVSIDEGAAIEEELFGSCFESYDQREGMANFLRKKDDPKKVKKVEFKNE